MLKIEPPEAVALETIAAEPTDTDRAILDHLAARREDKSPLEAVYLVKVRFKEMPPVTSMGWALYLGDYRVPKYSPYEHGIYFKVFDPHFFTEHRLRKLRFSQNGTDFVETRLKLTPPKWLFRGTAKTQPRLMSQSEALRSREATVAGGKVSRRKRKSPRRK